MKIDWKDVSYRLNEANSREKDLIILNVLEVAENYKDLGALEDSFLATLRHHKLLKGEENV